MEKFANPDAAFYAIAGLQGITGIAVVSRSCGAAAKTAEQEKTRQTIRKTARFMTNSKTRQKSGQERVELAGSCG